MKLFGVAYCFFLLLPLSISAEVLINEIAWMGSPTEGVDEKQWWRYEWIELYNTGDKAVSVDGWQIVLERDNPDLEIVLNGVMPSSGYMLVGASARIPGVDISYANLSGKFANSGQRVLLKNAAGVVVEEFDARDGWFGGDNETKTTMERRFLDRPSADPDNWGSSQNTGGTPKAENSIGGKEQFLALDKSIIEGVGAATKRDPPWASAFLLLTDKVFMLAALIALGSALSILALRRYVLRSLSPGADSSDALQD